MQSALSRGSKGGLANFACAQKPVMLDVKVANFRPTQSLQVLVIFLRTYNKDDNKGNNTKLSGIVIV